MAHLLIIDDDVSAADAMAALLRREGHEADVASTAREALATLRHAEPDLVLLDLTMPRVDGLDLLDALKDDPRFAGVRVAVYSGRGGPESVEAAERLGACDFIPKGGSWPSVYERIKANLRAGESARAVDA